MASQTSYIIQAFRKKGKRLVPDQPRHMKSAQAAIDGAKQLAASRAGVVAFTIESDPEVDFTGEPTVLFRAGEVPGELAE